MKILAFETSSHVASVAVVDEHTLLGEFTINHPRTHSQKLMPILEELLKQLDLKVKDMDYLAVSEGPGSFTGVRIGLSAVKGLAHPHNIPVVPVPTLEATIQPFVGFDGWVCPIMDARKNEIYTGVYQYAEDDFVPVIKECAIEPETFFRALKETAEEDVVKPSRILFMGDGLPKYETILKDYFGDLYMEAPAAFNRQRASSVAALAAKRLNDAVRYDDVHANYMRQSEAETTYDEKHGKK